MFKQVPSIAEYELSSQSDNEERQFNEKKREIKAKSKKIYSDLKESLSKNVENKGDNVLDNLVNSMNAFDIIRFSTLKDKKLKSEISELQKHHEMSIKICYKTQRKTIDGIPRTLKELREIVAKNLKSTRRTRVTIKDVVLYYFDYNAEKCLLVTEDDLKSAYDLTYKAQPPVLKL
jgi:tRNA U34 5-carboxymethylaminomethyl modifying enzyme MnmG/GidA